MNLVGTVWQEKETGKIVDVLQDDGGDWVKIKRRHKTARVAYKTKRRLKIECTIIERDE